MQVKATRFGTLDVDENKIIIFPAGIPGFENLRRFFIVPAEGTEDIHWLQAVGEPAVALLVIDPFRFFTGYSVDIPDTDLEELEIEKPSEILLLTTITVPRDNPAASTANLVAPIVINTRNNRAKQVILSDTPYTTKHRLFAVKKQAAGEQKAKAPGGEGR